MVCQYEASARKPVMATTAIAAKVSNVRGSNCCRREKKAGPRLELEPMMWSKTNFSGQGSSNRNPTSANRASNELAIRSRYCLTCGQKYFRILQRLGRFCGRGCGLFHGRASRNPLDGLDP